MRLRSACRGRRRRVRVGATVALGALVALVMAACGTSNSPPCNAGDLLSCACVGGASGTQACTSNGSYGPCSCAAADSGSPSEGGAEGGAGNLPYMASCSVVGKPGDCSPANGDECFDFPNRGMYCTHPCTSNTQCPLPSTGCNGMGVCKAPGASNSGEAGVDGD